MKSVIHKIEYVHNGIKYHHDQFGYWCEGCGFMHVFALKPDGGHHTWNNDYARPTVNPSLVQNFTPGRMCHSWMRDGNIQYLGDCFHHLKGETMALLTTDQWPKPPAR